MWNKAGGMKQKQEMEEATCEKRLKSKVSMKYKGGRETVEGEVMERSGKDITWSLWQSRVHL